ncbi:MAG: flippase [Sulfitobacter sp.]
MKTTKDQTTSAMILRGSGLILGALVTILAARMLEPAGFGAFSFVLAIVTLLSSPLVAGLRQTLVREIAYATGRKEPQRPTDVWTWVSRWAVWTTAGLVTVLGIWINWGVQDAMLRWHLLLGIGLIILTPAPQLLSGVLLGFNKALRSQFPEFLVRPVLTLGLLVVADVFFVPGPMSVTVALVILGVALLADTLLCLVLVKEEPGIGAFRRNLSLTKEDRRDLMMSSLSFGAITSVYLINSNLDLVMLGILASDVDVGLYNAATLLASLAAFGLGVINTIIMPQIAQLHAEGDRDALQAVITRATRRITGIACASAVLLWFGGTLALTLIFDASYTAGYTAMIILMLGQFANACFGPVAIILNMTGHQKMTLIGLSVSVAVNGVLNFTLVPRFGIEGAAVATTVSTVVWNVLLVWALKSRTGYRSTIFG